MTENGQKNNLSINQSESSYYENNGSERIKAISPTLARFVFTPPLSWLSQFSQTLQNPLPEAIRNYAEDLKIMQRSDEQAESFRKSLSQSFRCVFSRSKATAIGTQTRSIDSGRQSSSRTRSTLIGVKTKTWTATDSFGPSRSTKVELGLRRELNSFDSFDSERLAQWHGSALENRYQ